MVRPVTDVLEASDDQNWYVLACGHHVLALDYSRSKAKQLRADHERPHKEWAFCPECWAVEMPFPVGR